MRTTSTFPSPRTLQAMVLGLNSPEHGALAGVNASSTNDTWEYDGANWAHISTSTRPSARYHSAVAYDFVRQKMALYGGYDSSAALADTWEYDGSTWTARTRTHNLDTGMAYDEERARVALVGGQYMGRLMSDVWEWQGTDWTQLVPSGTAPFARRKHSIFYELNRERVVILGGEVPGGHANDM